MRQFWSKVVRLSTPNEATRENIQLSLDPAGYIRVHNDHRPRANADAGQLYRETVEP